MGAQSRICARWWICANGKLNDIVYRCICSHPYILPTIHVNILPICDSFCTNAVAISDIKQHFVSFELNKCSCGFSIYLWSECDSDALILSSPLFHVHPFSLIFPFHSPIRCLFPLCAANFVCAAAWHMERGQAKMHFLNCRDTTA